MTNIYSQFQEKIKKSKKRRELKKRKEKKTKRKKKKSYMKVIFSEIKAQNVFTWQNKRYASLSVIKIATLIPKDIFHINLELIKAYTILFK